MKIEKTVCDRCGEEVTYPAIRKLHLSGLSREGEFDLCNNCHKELYVWFKNKNRSDKNDKRRSNRTN